MKTIFLLLLLISLQGETTSSYWLNNSLPSPYSHTNTSTYSNYHQKLKKGNGIVPEPDFFLQEFSDLTRSHSKKNQVLYLPVEEELSIAVEGCILNGTLLLPNNLESTVPLVIIIAGSGPTDRNGNSILLPAECNKYKMLAEQLAANHIATFRYDKRAVGLSKLSPERRAKLGFKDYVDDAVSLVDYFKQDNRFSQIIIAGHSEGSLIGILASYDIKFDAFISIAGSGRNMGKVLLDQISEILHGDPLLDTVSVYIDKLREGKKIETINPDLSLVFHPSIHIYLAEFFRHDPSKAIKQLNIPVLIVQGSADAQINENDAKLLFKAKPSAELEIIEGMNHALKTASIDDSEANFNSELPINRELVNVIVRFVHNL